MDFIVNDTFILKGRGLIAVCQTNEQIFDAKIDNLVKIIHSDNTCIDAQINGLDYFERQCFTETSVKTIGFLFNQLSKTDVPIGSIIKLL